MAARIRLLFVKWPSGHGLAALSGTELHRSRTDRTITLDLKLRKWRPSGAPFINDNLQRLALGTSFCSWAPLSSSRERPVSLRGSELISFLCATQPKEQAIAHLTVNLSVVKT